ncbi:MAG: shikimate kinase [Desulfopila sp.]
MDGLKKSELIILVGYRGVGKTTIGKRLACSLGYAFCDTDEEIVRLQGEDIASIVARLGWQGFRAMEYSVLQRLKKLTRTVVATGGGAIEHGDIWPELQRHHAVVVWLHAAQHVILRRISQDGHSLRQRPSLTDQAQAHEIITMLVKRNPLYRQAAQLEIDSGVLSVDQAVAEISRFLSASSR